MKILVAGVVAAVLTAAPCIAPLFAQPLVADGPRSSIGVSIVELTGDQAAKAKVESGGVLIERVHEGTPAARAGFKAGDVVVEFDGERVRSTRQFTRLVQETPPNQPVRATVVRDGARQTFSVTPELGRAVGDPSSEIRALADGHSRYATPFPNSTDWSAPPAIAWFVQPQVRLGASIGVLGEQLASYFGVKQGVLVESVDAGSPAADAGLKAGDVITEIDGRAVSEPAQVTDAVRTAQPGASVDLQVVRDKKPLTLKATLPQPDRQRARTARPI